MNRLRLLGALLVTVLCAVALLGLAVPAHAYDVAAAPARTDLCDYGVEPSDQERWSRPRPGGCDRRTYDSAPNRPGASARVDRYAFAPQTAKSSRRGCRSLRRLLTRASTTPHEVWTRNSASAASSPQRPPWSGSIPTSIPTTARHGGVRSQTIQYESAGQTALEGTARHPPDG